MDFIQDYETMIILTPVLTDEEMKNEIEMLHKLMTDHGVELVHKENWGLKKFTYEIKHKSTGFYYLIEFKAKGEFVEILETAYRRNERILRFLTTKLDKHAVEYNRRRRNGEFKKGDQEDRNSQ